MPFITDLLRGINSTINPPMQAAPTGPTYPNGPTNAGMQYPVPQTMGNNPPPPGGQIGFSPTGFETPILERYRDELVDNLPEWRRPNLLRMLMTGAYSALQRTPDETVEVRGPDGLIKQTTIKKGHWDPFDYKETDAILNQPNYRDIDLWKMRTDALGKGSQIENTINNNRSLAAQRYGNLDVANRREGRLDEQGNRALDIRLMDAQTRERLAKLKDLSESEKLELLQSGRINLEELRASNQYTLQELRGSQRMDQINRQGDIRSGQIQQQGNIRNEQIDRQNEADLREIDARTRGQIEVKGTPSANAGVNSTLPTQQKQAIINRANSVAQSNPEWSKYITIDPETKLPVIAPAGGNGWFSNGLTEDVRKQIVNSIYGSGGEPIASGSSGTTQKFKFDPSIHPVTKEGKVGIRDKDGNLFAVDPKLVDQYIAKGYTVVTSGGK